MLSFSKPLFVLIVSLCVSICPALAQDEALRALGNTSRAVSALAWSPDGSRLATGSAGQIKIFEAQSGEVAGDFFVGKVPIKALAWAPDAKTLAVGGAAGAQAVQLLDAATGKTQKSLNIPTAPTALRFSPDGARLVIAGADENLRFYDLDKGEFAPTISGFKYPVYALAFAPEGKTLVAAGGGVLKSTSRSAFDSTYAETLEGEISTVDLTNLSIIHQQSVAGGSSNCALSSDGRNVAFAGGGGYNQAVFEAIGGKMKRGTVWHLNQARWLFQAAPDAGDYGVAHTLGETALGAPPVRVPIRNGRTRQVASADSGLRIGLGVAGVVGAAQDITDGLAATIPPAGALSFSADGTLLGLPSAQTTKYAIWDGKGAMGKRLADIEHGTVSISAFAPVGLRLALAGGSVVYLWESK